jgi:hypothetical protein
MKSIIFIILVLSSNLIFSQDVYLGFDSRTALQSILYASYTTGELGVFYNKPKDIVGNIYVFEDWNNKCKIVVGEDVFKLSNINLNMKTDQFEALVGKDSMFAFNTSNIDLIYINDRKFKSFYVSNIKKNKNFELIYDGEEIKLLKGYEVGIKYNDPDPLMVKKNVDNYFTTETYFIKTGEEFNELKLKEKDMLKIFGDKADLISKFVKENKLSYKDDKDLNRIFIYYDSL